MAFHDHHRSLQTEEVHTLLRNLLKNPAKFRHHVRRTAAAIILKLTYGIHIDEHVDEEGDNYVALADKAMFSLAAAGIWGTYIVDYIPSLKHIPLWFREPLSKDKPSNGKKTVRILQIHSGGTSTNRTFFEQYQGSASSSIVSEELEDMACGRTQGSELLIRNVAATTYAAGSDTTVSAIISLFLAMAIYPEVQKKAQKELDRLNRLPLFTDREQLPYIDCICEELIRWNPVTPLGIARVVSEDDQYRGYRIPKGTTILPNTWAILHDPNVYPNPLQFDPDRYLNPEANAAQGINEPPDAAFGFGRRSCPGRWFAYDTLWIAVASILSVYEISKPLDEHGQPKELEPLYESRLLSHPCPFECQIIPRSPSATAAILQTSDENFEL
ncbi:cytochrome P450 [Gymnopus androsaceus JB14]|uniref:Cytochrome P450 n=1 Tax=Gymnopus androsaceus JB14 TaxID=1447944 RepID=A0A6A4IME6_9AGAR|nr:cytochrome P450 [Gymnopus androsaceus JB14]